VSQFVEATWPALAPP